MNAEEKVAGFSNDVDATERRFLQLIDRSIDDSRVAPLSGGLFMRAQELRERARRNREADAIEL